MQPTTPEDVQPGDVLTFLHPGGSTVRVTHRVTEVLGDGESLAFRTKGDANSRPDDWIVTRDKVLGTVIWDTPYLGYVTDTVNRREGFIGLIAIPAALIVFGELRNIARQLRLARAIDGSAGDRIRPPKPQEAGGTPDLSALYKRDLTQAQASKMERQ